MLRLLAAIVLLSVVYHAHSAPIPAMSATVREELQTRMTQSFSQSVEEWRRLTEVYNAVLESLKDRLKAIARNL